MWLKKIKLGCYMAYHDFQDFSIKISYHPIFHENHFF